MATKLRIVQSDEALMLVASVIAILGALTFVIFGWSGGGTP